MPPGTGGLPVPRPDQVRVYPPNGVQPGSFAGIVRARLVIVSGAGVSGVFVYNGTPGLGNPPIVSITNGSTDPFGNPVVPGLDVTQGQITGSVISGSTFEGTDFILNSAGFFFYTGTPAAGNLFASVTSSNGTDTFGNAYIQGFEIHGLNAGSSGNASFTSAGPFNWTAPPGVTTVTVQATAGGGGSGSDDTGNPFTSAGGGGGEYASEPALAVTAGNVYSGTVGAGGTAGAAGANNPGGAGGNTTFTGNSVTVTAHGGGGGASGGGSGSGGAGGTGSTNTTHFNGGAGGANSNTDVGGGGGSSGGTASAGNPGVSGSAGGAGGAAVAGGGPGANAPPNGAGTSPATGPGGGAGGANSIGTNVPGGAGFQGQVLLSWTSSTPSESGAYINQTTQGGVPFLNFSTGVSFELESANIEAFTSGSGGAEVLALTVDGPQVTGFPDMAFFTLSSSSENGSSSSAFGALSYQDRSSVVHEYLEWGATGVVVNTAIPGDTNSYQTERLTLSLASDLVINTTPFSQEVFPTINALGTGTYQIDGYLRLSATAAAGTPEFEFATGTAVATMSISFWEMKDGAPATFGNSGAVAAFSASFVGAAMTGTGRDVFFRGLMVVTTAGSLGLFAASSVAADTFTISHLGSFMNVYPVGE
jgi:hypothetical protein